MSPELEAIRPPSKDISLPEIADDVPLPPRYSSMFDSKGRVYYLDHEKKTTQWLNPVKATEFKKRGIKGIDLCFRRTTAKGLEYLVNYNTGDVVGPHWNGSYGSFNVFDEEGKSYETGFKEGKLDVSVRGAWPQEAVDRIKNGNILQHIAML
jgi:WW domain